MTNRLWVNKDTNIKPRCIKIDLDRNGYGFGTYGPFEAVIIRYENKEYVAKPSDLIDALVASGLFKAVEE